MTTAVTSLYATSSYLFDFLFHTHIPQLTTQYFSPYIVILSSRKFSSTKRVNVKQVLTLRHQNLLIRLNVYYKPGPKKVLMTRETVARL